MRIRPARRPRGAPWRAGLALAPLLLAAPLRAGEADVVDAEAECRGAQCRFEVTVRHADEGWKHYADRYEVLTEEGEVLGTRVLHHPHVDEQPFTRGVVVTVPESVRRVRIRAGDSRHGLGGEERTLELERGPGS